ncbi:MAG TPA: imidazolonepropionase [Usitatibacter sp.]|nr:imidazolonepropionase [Usitatibacter sp.]
MARTLVVNARIATMREGRYSIVENGAIVEESGRIVSVGQPDDAMRGDDTVDARGALVTPALVDCHTHLVFAGNRAREFEMRLRGATYEEIARAGGGILSTVKATRLASEDDLRVSALVRLDAMLAEGVSTVEVKSGYGLDVENELKCLRVARSLGRERSVTIVTTLLGAHTVPPEFKGRADAYVQLLCSELIPRAAREKLADGVDAFCEGIGFTPEQTRRVFTCAREHGLAVRLHADQLSNLGGAALAAEFGALSADHLEHTDEAGAQALARAGTVAVLLPGAFYFLRETKKPPVEALRKHGVAMAVATDCNPGTSPNTSLLTAMNMACTLFGLTPEEALAGATTHAARALGLGDRGVLEPGRRADCVVWDAEEPAELAWTIAGRKPRRIIRAG